ncbi:transcription initiation factor TFIID subunit 9 [Anthonomus grandis grandis]|uniref:transcription initiation factor TFIID subunit 9 n=1 Tax=Anthonomus grandis grandis TaxID=2921223 RepID=UPI002165249D|nr:transcription initiation factor TFIID subunit 9 [Anthonomus grandis grandis]
MADKEKSEKPKPSQPKHIPKDGQVVLAIMKEMGITEYEPKTIVQLTEFVYRYATSVLQEARMYANNSNKRTLDIDDIRLAIELSAESSFTTPPPREVVIECASAKNYTMLPSVKPHCGLRLPPDRYCLSSCNYTLKAAQKKMATTKTTFNPANPAMKMANKSNISFIRKQAPIGRQNVTIPKPTMKISSSPMTTVVKPKIQITQNVQIAAPSIPSSMQVDLNSLKRKREDDSDLMN